MLKINNTFYVSVEGDSELLYLDRLQYLINSGDYNFTVKFIKKKTKPVSFVKSNSNIYKEFPYFHICDFEGSSSEDKLKFTHIMDNIKEARIIKKCKYILCYTNLCFELWLILHKKNFAKSLTNKEDYLDEINNLYNTDIKSWKALKNEDNVNDILEEIDIDDVKFAIKNAKILSQNNAKNYQLMEYKGTKYYKENPSLNLHEFIELVLDKCKIK